MSDKDSSKLLEDVIKELQQSVESAISAQVEDLEPAWAEAEKYYNGYTNLQEFEGRSTVVKTEVRDAVRNLMPSIMRTLLHSRTPVVFQPSSVKHAAWVEQQAEYCVSLFYRSNGYLSMYSSIMDALKLRRGVLKAFWLPSPSSVFQKYTSVPYQVAEELGNDPNFTVKSVEESAYSKDDDSVLMYDVTGHRTGENGRTTIEPVPSHEFFISRNCTSIEDAIERGVHGQQQIVTVDEAKSYGIEYDDWESLDADDPELGSYAESSKERRGNVKDSPNDDPSLDELRHEFLLTEVYVSYDLEDTGRLQLYKFFLGGSSYVYLDHEEVEDSPFAITVPIPIPHHNHGHSIADFTIEEQDTNTSLLRAIVDNAHAANNPRLAADPQRTSFRDLVNPAIGAPIKKKSTDTLQVVSTPFTGQGSLGLLQYLDTDVQNKVGVTKAAQGLDPDAMQSTDKNAVLNTIMTGQGQTELMVRNIVETSLIRLFRILLRLSIRHMPPQQIFMTKGVVIPVNTAMFDSDAVAQPNVGLGTASPMQKQAALSFILTKQEQYMKELGPNNPFTSYAQMYNTIEALLETQSIYNVGSFFKLVTPNVEAKFAELQQKRQEQMAMMQQQNQPMDPSKAFIEVEKAKRQIDLIRETAKAALEERKLSLEAAKESGAQDIARDKLALDEIVKLAQLELSAQKTVLDKEQETNNDETASISTSTSGTSEGSNQ